MNDSEPLFLAIDAGTGSARALAFDRAGTCVAWASREWKHQPLPGYPGGLVFDTQSGWLAIAGAIREVVESTPGRHAVPMSTRTAQLRFGSWGPGYLAQHPDAAVGVIVLRPGDEFENHLHEHHAEWFVILEGNAVVWLDRESSVVADVGDVVRAEPGQEHFVQNPFPDICRALFIKTPWVEGDRINIPWRPEVAQ